MKNDVSIFETQKLILECFKMGKKEKVVEVKPPTDYFKGVQVDLKTVKTAVLNLESTEVSVLTKCASSIFNFIVKGRVLTHKNIEMIF